MENVISVREVQRNYRKLVNKAKRDKKPIFLGAHFKPEAVIMDYNFYKILEQRPRNRNKTWQEIKKSLYWIAKGGKQKTSLSKFVYEDRKRH